MERPYTSVSTALAQKVLEYPKKSAPERAPIYLAQEEIFQRESNLSNIRNIRLLERAENKTEIILVRRATWSNMGTRVKTLPINKNMGEPGGWATPNVYLKAMKSPQSQH